MPSSSNRVIMCNSDSFVCSVVFVGHSLGAGIATLCTASMDTWWPKLVGVGGRAPIFEAKAFAPPPVGDATWHVRDSVRRAFSRYMYSNVRMRRSSRDMPRPGSNPSCITTTSCRGRKSRVSSGSLCASPRCVHATAVTVGARHASAQKRVADPLTGVAQLILPGRIFGIENVSMRHGHFAK